MIVVGSGVLGLSVAEWFSRFTKVKIVSNEDPRSGSQAAGASLATKAQCYARDTHFALKLEARQIYESWLLSLLGEAAPHSRAWAELDFAHLYREGEATESFQDSTACSEQLRRLTQPMTNLLERGFHRQPLRSEDETQIRFENEAWVDAATLLKLLRFVLENRGVHFVSSDVCALLAGADAVHETVVLCTGAWTPSLLTRLGLTLSNKRRPRLTLGSTFSFDCREPLDVLARNVYFESHAQDSKALVMGHPSRATLASTVARSDELVWRDELLSSHEDQLWRTATRLIPGFEASAPSAKLAERRAGWRIGFGHSEIVIERIEHQALAADLIVCAGAHKSGFLFAPVVGHCVQNLHPKV